MIRGRDKGFTLVEMLVVIAIVGIIMGMLLTAVNGVRAHAKKTKARHDVSQIATAWLQYQQEYKKFPAASITDMGSDAVIILRGTPAHADNPRGLFFMDFSTNTTSFLDPWNCPYFVDLDTDYDNKVVIVGVGDIYRSVAVRSKGADGVVNTADDIQSWRR